MAMEIGSRKRTASCGPIQSTPVHKKTRLLTKPYFDGMNTPELVDEQLSAYSQGSPAPSLPYTEGSIAETTFTSASTSQRPRRYVCDFPDCDKAFDRPVRLETHKRSHTNERPYACTEEGCDKTFLRNEHLTRHIKDKHADERNYTCTYIISAENGDSQCGKTFNTGTRLRRHMAAHEEKENTRCHEPGCGKVFRKQETLQRHIKKDHLHEKAFVCNHKTLDESGQSEECGESFTTVGQLKGHVSRAHSSPRFFCELCPVLVPNPSLETETLEMGVETTIPVVQEGMRPVFATHADLQLHLKTVHPPTCPECGKECESGKALKAHQDIEHSSLPERQQFKCNWSGCDRGFTKAGNLKVHIQNVHVKARNFVCGTFDLTENPKTAGWNGQGCGAAFGTKSNLEEHVRTQHLGMASKIRPSRLKKKVKEEGSWTPSTLMDIDEISTPTDAAGETALAMLTGVGYENSKRIACLIHGCQLRFSRDYDLAQHVELTHGWHIDDVNEAIAERDALTGDDFWIGGNDLVDIQVNDDFREQLSGSFDFGSISGDMTHCVQQDAHVVNTGAKTWGSSLPGQNFQGPSSDLMLDPALYTNCG